MIQLLIMRHIKSKPSKFLYIVITVWIFVITLSILNFTGLVPYYIDGSPSKADLIAIEESRLEQIAIEEEERLKPIEVRVKLPTRIVIPILGKDLPISNPNTTNIEELDKELLNAVVRYPGSGTLGRDGNMLIFGHSSGLRNIQNEMFKAFNGIETLSAGNFINLISDGIEYVYAVSNIEHEKASNVTVEFVTDPGVKQITLTTCNTFGAKEDRWIITADFVGSHPVE